jgi:isoleucyl-tRNA synthetase
MAEFPTPEELTAGLAAGERERFPDWEQLMEIRDLVLKSLEVARQEKFIGAPLEARVHLAAGSETYSLLDRFEQELPSLFIVSQVALEERPGVKLSVHIERAEGEKCERCWKYTSDVGSHPQLPTICASCAEVVSEVARS